MPWQLEAEGTEPLVLGIFDTQLQQHCRFVPDALGQLRCVPDAPVEPQVTPYYLDAACKQRIYRLDPETLARAASYPIPFPIWSDNECDRRRYIFARATQLEQPADVFYGPDCAPLSGLDTLGDILAFTIVAAAPDSFVAGNIVEGPALTDRLRLQRIETETGEQFDAHIVDSEYGSPCTVSDTDPPTCIPPFSEAQSFFADEECTKLVWRVLPCEVPTFIRTSNGSYTFGKPYTGQVWTNANRTVCHPYEPTDPPASFHERGDNIQPHATFAWQPVGSGVLQVRGIADSAGQVTVVASPLAPKPRYHDAVAAADCDVVWNLSGDARCVSHIRIPDVRTASGNSFSDEQCQKPVWGCDPDCADPSDLAVLFPPLPQTRASSVAVLVPVKTLYALDRACTLISPNAAAGITLGSTVPWTAFPKIPERNPRTPPGP